MFDYLDIIRLRRVEEEERGKNLHNAWDFNLNDFRCFVKSFIRCIKHTHLI